MRTRTVVVLLFLVSCCFAVASPVEAQQSNETRRVVRRVDPIYPAMARRMNLSGTVKVFAVVAPDGSVKSVQPVGGSPLLVESAQSAIRRWKYAPASAESKELIELHFHPE